MWPNAGEEPEPPMAGHRHEPSGPGPLVRLRLVALEDPRDHLTVVPEQTTDAPIRVGRVGRGPGVPLRASVVSTHSTVPRQGIGKSALH